jgi:hypothetical protein
MAAVEEEVGPVLQLVLVVVVGSDYLGPDQVELLALLLPVEVVGVLGELPEPPELQL